MTGRLARAAIGLAVVGLGAIDLAGQRPNFSTRIEHVRVDVLVSEKNRPLIGLQKDDFEVIDNGVPQQVEFAGYEQIPLNVIIVLDMSASVAGERLDHLRAAVRAVLDRLKSGDQAALVTFSQALSLGSKLTADFGPIRRALDLVQGENKTSLVDASFAGMLLSESDAGRALQIVFSDGLDVSSWLRPEAVLDSAKRSDAVVYSVSVGGKPSFLRQLSALTGGTIFEVESTTNLSGIFLSILEEFRHRYLVSYTPSGVPLDGWHRLAVRVKGRSASIKARPGYLAAGSASP